jgi:hypothetical protein
VSLGLGRKGQRHLRPGWTSGPLAGGKLVRGGGLRKGVGLAVPPPSSVGQGKRDPRDGLASSVSVTLRFPEGPQVDGERPGGPGGKGTLRLVRVPGRAYPAAAHTLTLAPAVVCALEVSPCFLPHEHLGTMPEGPWSWWLLIQF